MSKIQEQTDNFLGLRGNRDNFDSENWTESDTRSKFIDTILIGCLGWKEDDIRREVSIDGLRLDYLLSTTRPILVLEAKKAKKAFPVFQKPSIQKIKIRTFITSNPAIKVHIEQVAEYCFRHSAPIAVLTNGKTYLIFVAVRTDGVPWLDGKIIIIPDIFDESFNYSDIYNLLSKHIMLSGNLLSQLLVDEIPIKAKNVLNCYNNPNATIPRNPFGLALEPLLQQVFSDVTKEDSSEVLEHCYVLPGETTLYKAEFEALLIDRPPKYSEAILSVSNKNQYEKFQEHIKEYLARKNWAQTLFVIGGLGVGKTMFLRRFFNPIINKEPLSEKTQSFYVDFRKPGLDPRKVPELIYEKLYEEVLELDQKPVPGEQDIFYDFSSFEGLQQIFWPQMQRFLRGPEGKLKDIDEKEYEKAKINLLSSMNSDKVAFVKGAFKVLRERYHRHTTVILDNADQCKPEYQESIYLFSRTLETDLQCLIIVSLREEWYWHFSKKGGPLSAYHDLVYHIPAPRVRNVLDKRIDYALELLQKYQIPKAYVDLDNDFHLEAGHLIKYLTIFKNAFIKNEDVTVFYECLSNGNIRKGLDAFLEFLRSGHTHVDEYLKAITLGRHLYVLKFHQVFKSISRGSYYYYSSNRSIIPNVFLPIAGVGGLQMSYFIKVYLLHYLSTEAKINTEVGQGYVPISQAKLLLAKLGLDESSRKQMIITLFDEELVEPNIRLSDDYADWTHIRITAFGLYTIRQMTYRFAYLEAIMLDTPLKDSRLLNRIIGLYVEGKKPSLHQRMLCVKDFIDYLHKEEAFEQIRVQQTGLTALFPEYMPIIQEQIVEEIKELQEEIKSNPFM